MTPSGVMSMVTVSGWGMPIHPPTLMIMSRTMLMTRRVIPNRIQLPTSKALMRFLYGWTFPGALE